MRASTTHSRGLRGALFVLLLQVAACSSADESTGSAADIPTTGDVIDDVAVSDDLPTTDALWDVPEPDDTDVEDIAEVDDTTVADVEDTSEPDTEDADDTEDTEEPDVPMVIPCDDATDCPEGAICAGGSCGACAVDVQCVSGYGQGATCIEGLCQPLVCPPGTLGCPCDAETCADGVCVDDVCTACDDGDVGCFCYPNDTCNAGAICQDGMCVDCPVGEVGCACYPNDTCNQGARCEDGTCDACPVGTLGCDCGEAPAGSECADSMCVDGTCAPCVAGALGCPCLEGACTDGVCESGACVPCTDGVIGCPCTADGTCTGGLCEDGACGPCIDGVIGCACGADGACEGGLCEAGECGPCVDGVIGCACDAGACTTGNCVLGDCLDCTKGAVGCACFGNGSCSLGGTCDADNVCAACDPSVAGCPCSSDGTCGTGLVCSGGVCAVDTCSAGTLGCPCDDGGCDDGTCLNGLCAACSSDIVGCPCDDGVCTGGLVCDGLVTVCRTAKTCAQTCVAHQVCETVTGADPTCLESCEAGWSWSAESGSCEAVVPTTCEPDAPGSIADECAEANKACEPADEDGGDATCEGCLEFFVVDEGDADLCRPVLTCEALGCEGKNQACAAATETTDATCGACLEYFIPGDDPSTCVAVETCASLGCAGQNRSCTAAEPAKDAQCGDCLDFYLPQEGSPICRAVDTCESLGCEGLNRACTEGGEALDAVCDGCLPYFLVDEAAPNSCRAVLNCGEAGCAAQNRTCIDSTSTADATCADCKSFFKEVDGSCVAVLTCEELGCAGLNRECAAATETADASCGACSPYFLVSEDNPEACRSVLSCEAAGCDERNRNCDADTETSDAVCLDCLPFYLGDDDDPEATCVAVVTCSDLACGDTFRNCDAASEDANAACGGCIDDYIDVDGTCEVAPLNCQAGEPGDISDTCTAENRECVEPSDAEAYCGSCLTNYAEATDGTCDAVTLCDETSLDCAGKNRTCEGTAPFQSCGDCLDGTVESPEDPTVCEAPVSCSDKECGDDEFCIDGDGVTTTASCVENACPDGEAYSDYTGECEVCIVACGDEPGETGRIWPYTLEDKTSCICETEAGYFWDDSGREAVECDADGDGWVRDDAEFYLQTTDDAHLLQNARCELKVIDRFVLENDMGQRLTVYLCDDDDTPFLRQDLGPCVFPAYLSLFETTRNDEQDRLNESGLAPVVSQGGVGRMLRASEVNPLTRACTQGGDYNDNAQTDIREWHGKPNDGLSAADYALTQFSYFLELHDSFYEAGTESLDVGQYVIRERSRCDAGFPLDYGEVTSEYWRSCTRSRDANFDHSFGDETPDFGYDFAGWSCDSESGTCPIPPPPTNDVGVNDVIPDHGICDLDEPFFDEACNDADIPWLCVNGAAWRGMSHHSQFRCVVVDDTASTVEPRQPTTDFDGGYDADYLLMQCGVACPDGDASCESDCDGTVCDTTTSAIEGPGNPTQPELTCTVNESPVSGDVGFAVVMYKTGATGYARGCIDEWAPTASSGDILLNGSDDAELNAWRRLCSGYETAPQPVIGQGLTQDFGRLVCGCGDNHGGTGCSDGCPDGELFISDGYESTPRTGYWMCARNTATGYATQDATYGPALVGSNDDTDWVIEGQVQGRGTTTNFTKLCSETVCDAKDRPVGARGTTAACGFSYPCGGSALTYSEAKAHCESEGGRLCTETEVKAGEPTGSGCSYDSVRIWTGTPCGENAYRTTRGSPKSGTNIADECSDVSTTAAVRCCADADACEPSGWQIR